MGTLSISHRAHNLRNKSGDAAGADRDRLTESRRVITEDGTIACDKCGCKSEAESEEQAESFGWVVERGLTPHAHTCPACREAAG
jgi:hypothetical protein